MRKVQFTETVLRDANQSLMATRLPYADYADILPTMDKAGYYSIDCWGGATFDSCLRYLNEDPWERLRKLRKNLPNNKLIKVNDYEAAVQLAAGGLGWTMTMEYLLPSISDRDEYNFAELPSSLIQSDNGLTLHTESSAKTREVAREMADKIQDMLKKQGKIQ